MRMITLGMLWSCIVLSPPPVFAQSGNGSEIDALRGELAAMRADYETRIALLEQRLDAAEQNVTLVQQETAAAAVQPAPAATAGVGGGSNAFNPDIGVVFQGQGWSYDKDPDLYQIPGFPLGGEAGPLAQGLALGETELNFSANVDDKFTAWLTVPIAVEDDGTSVDVEEAWIETLALPAGLSVRLGRHFANIGYLNDKHAHTWDFADQPLPYQAFLGGQYIDDGVVLRWLAPTDFYLELGSEVNRGDNYPAGGAAHSGLGSYAMHARLGGDIGYSNSWQAGVSYLHADAGERVSGDADPALLFTGRSELMMAEFVWKWAPNGNIRQRNFKFQAEYLWRNEAGRYTLNDGHVQPYDNDQQGWYAQAVFQPFPRWRLGIRWDQLSTDNPGAAFAGTPLMPMGGDPHRYSVMTDWSNSEFSRIRLQYTRDEAGLEDDNQLGLQYIFSIGAHGAHTF